MKRALALLLLCVMVAACRTRVPVPGIAIPLDDPRPAALLRSLAERAATRPALRASAKLQVAAPDLRFNRPQRLAVARPARLRVEILGLFDQIAAVLVTDGEIYQLYDADSRDLEQGPVSRDLLWRVARVDLDPLETVDLLLGAPQLQAGLRLGAARLLPDGGIVLEAQDAKGRAGQRFAFDASGLITRVERLDADGRTIWQARFEDYRSLPGPEGGEQPFAHVVALRFPRVEAEARLTFKRVVLASELPDEIFTLTLGGRAASDTAPELRGGAL